MCLVDIYLLWILVLVQSMIPAVVDMCLCVVACFHVNRLEDRSILYMYLKELTPKFALVQL